MRFGVGGGKPTPPAARFNFAQETVAQGVQHPWNGDQRCGPLALYRANDLSRIGRALEDDGGAEKRRYHQSHELPENVAERHQRDKPQRVKPPFPFAVWLDAALEWLKIRQEIAMRKDDPARFRRRPRCEEDFGHGVASEGVVASGAALVFRKTSDGGVELIEDRGLTSAELRKQRPIRESEAHFGIPEHGRHEVRCRAGIEGHSHRPARQNPPERG